MIKIKNVKVPIATLVLLFSLTGCTRLTKEQKEAVKRDRPEITTEVQENEIAIERTGEPQEIRSTKLDHDFNLSFVDEEINKASTEITYDYLVDLTSLSNEEINKISDSEEYHPLPRATMAHVITKNGYSNKMIPFDEKEGFTSGTFYCEDRDYLPIIIPDTLREREEVRRGIIDLLGKDLYADTCNVTCTKMETIDGELLYYVVATIEDKNKNVLIETDCLYQLVGHDIVTLYRKQTGDFADDENVVIKNVNDKNPVLIPINKTIFSDLNGTYKESFLKEALDVYCGEDNYYNKENDNLDFTQYQK